MRMQDDKQDASSGKNTRDTEHGLKSRNGRAENIVAFLALIVVDRIYVQLLINYMVKNLG